MRTVALSVLLMATLPCCVEKPHAQARRPNVVYFLVDNLGMGELSIYSGGPFRGATTRIDDFARQGMMLLNFAPEAQCTPSRSALMTGRYSIRSGNHTVALAGSHSGLVKWERTLGDILTFEGGLGRSFYAKVDGTPLPRITNVGIAYYRQFKATSDVASVLTPLIEGKKDHVFGVWASKPVFSAQARTLARPPSDPGVRRRQSHEGADARGNAHRLSFQRFTEREGGRGAGLCQTC